MVDNCANRGFRSLNLGIGAAAYKSSLCDLKGHQFDTFVAMTMRGRLFTLLLSATYRVKGAIKRNPVMWNFVQSLRAKRFARPPAD
jgi:CelD/BcsL family acetyltransferase involved in cellulose biosynthesis